MKQIVLMGMLLFSSVFASQGPVPIFYGLNESHGTGWARMRDDGVVGVTCFETGTRSNSNGDLKYKTRQPDGTVSESLVAHGVHLDISVLLYDLENQPHIFVARSTADGQHIDHYFQDGQGWSSETVLNFKYDGGGHIYELSADRGPDGSFHLAVLITRSNPDSEDYYFAFRDARLLHASNQSGHWHAHLLHIYDTEYTNDEHVKVLKRQDIRVDNQGHVHVVYGELINILDPSGYSRLQYATNRSGQWRIETVCQAPVGARDNSGWYPSVAIDRENRVHIACTYVQRVRTGSAYLARLMYMTRQDTGWEETEICRRDDGYYGTDGRQYTGGLVHLVFDNQNRPHIAFTDIASSHAGRNYLNLGNIRHAVCQNGEWQLSTVYRQPRPQAFYDATEMYGLCLLISSGGEVVIAGQEMVISDMQNYNCSLIFFDINTSGTISPEKMGIVPSAFRLNPNFPNPFNPETSVSFDLEHPAEMELAVFNARGQRVASLARGRKEPGRHLARWDGRLADGSEAPAGIYLFRLRAGSKRAVRRGVLLK